MAYILTILLIGVLAPTDADSMGIGMSALMFVVQMVLGAGLGFLIGKAAVWTINRINLSNHSLYSVLLLAFIFFSFAFTDLVKGNGYLAVYMSGLVVGNHKLMQKRVLTSFFDSFTWLVQIVMFLTLGLLVNVDELFRPEVLGLGCLIGAFMILVARPVTVFLCMAPFRKFSLKARLYVSWVGLRGAVPKTKIEREIEEVIPRDAAGDFNQSLIELGAIVCLPNGEPRCCICPVNALCLAHSQGRETEFPVKTKAKERRIEKRTVLLFRDEEKAAIRKRPAKGLLAGMYEFPNREGDMDHDEVVEYGRTLGLTPIRIKKLGHAKHIFSHVEWHMTGYEILVDELEKSMTGREREKNGIIFAEIRQLREEYPMPSAFEAYVPK